MGIFKFLWIVTIFYFLYYFIVYLHDRSKARKATINGSPSELEYVVVAEQHQPVNVVTHTNQTSEEPDEDQQAVDEKKNR